MNCAVACILYPHTKVVSVGFCIRVCFVSAYLLSMPLLSMPLFSTGERMDERTNDRTNERNGRAVVTTFGADSGSLILDLGYWLLDSEIWILDP